MGISRDKPVVRHTFLLGVHAGSLPAPVVTFVLIAISLAVLISARGAMLQTFLSILERCADMQCFFADFYPNLETYSMCAAALFQRSRRELHACAVRPILDEFAERPQRLVSLASPRCLVSFVWTLTTKSLKKRQILRPL
jgi:hypothetical protein